MLSIAQGGPAPATESFLDGTTRASEMSPPVRQPSATRWNRSDGVLPNWWNAGPPSLPSPQTASGGGFFGLFSQFMSNFQSWIGAAMAALTNAFGQPPAAPAAPQATFQNADLASVGDPHLGITGTVRNADGTTGSVDSHYDSMTAHGDLLDTQDFGDAFRVSTAVTAPAANGVTTNASATASMNGGNDAVTLARDGTLSVMAGGSAVDLAPGATLTFANGATATRGTDGSVTIAEGNAGGATLSTTFRANGSGVDVTAHAAGGVTLGGDLVGHALPNARRAV